ncbi:NAD(P)/FAD-dependent oxidoreductase [Sulfurimonas autotrophica]|uniref:HI0933 family protein n=1 Tax=Sulfurimonas autotrophica (strain ATCC BAA-671 / DSM 16294 / JCM 11897 / OK10) TaxID=563040 RepID=E0UUC7_SULAO|nr:NAD(P)/FAD-dependent oxidoreductase [Sulfurimonas autotrophica]ADN09502.1 HI0933 family protein [Sulfurimonas autotrophica DSM 16294]
MNKKIAIIGGGASGFLCAIFCAKAGVSVDLFEQNDKCAKKILVSGNGRCNITNKNLHGNDFFSQNPNFVEYAIKNFGFKEFEKFAASIGLVLHVMNDGRAYPLSNEAKSVAKIFEEYAKDLGVIFHTQEKITDIKKLTKQYERVVVASGSRAASHLGGNADAEEFAKTFGHSIINAYPSLVQLHLSSKTAHKMSGAKLNAEVTLLINHQKETTCNGDVLFTNYGVSGFAILDISQRASEALLEYQAVTLSINLLPGFTAQKLSAHILHVKKNIHEFTVLDILVGLVPLKIANGLLIDLHIDAASKNIDTKLSKKIANLMLNWHFEATETHGFRHAEVSGGGINTDEINPKTFESKKKKNLYFIGECLDVVGRRGGYNFAFAWASAYTAAKAITAKS